jgi:hypothetical protein
VRDVAKSGTSTPTPDLSTTNNKYLMSLLYYRSIYIALNKFERVARDKKPFFVEAECRLLPQPN